MADRRPTRRTPHRSSSTPPRRSAPSKGSAAGTGKGGRHPVLRKVLWGLLVVVLVLALIATVAVAVFYRRTDLPDPNKDFQSNTSFVYYNDSTTKLGSFSIQNRQSIPYSEMPQSIKDAVVSAENRSFWTDPGISPSGIVRAAWTIARGGEVQGGSTITQQYIKVLYLSQERTMQRKLKELVLAVKMGKQVPKEDILAGYLNTIYFGRGAYGIQAASKAYFNEDASKLTVPQAAVLASIINSPSLFDPSDGKASRERLLNRYRYVLDGMREMGSINQAEYDRDARALPTFPDVPINNRWAGPRGYLLKMVQSELLDHGFTDSQINGGGLTVTTTFDPRLQAKAVEVAEKYRKEAGANAGAQGAKNLHPAIASVKVGTGEVLALYGGPDFVTQPRNWATTARPAASTFKTYAAIAGMRNGFSLRSSLDGDTFTPKGDSVPVRNEFNEQYGTVSLLTATEKSINTAFVDMVSQIKDGPAQVIKAANDTGVPKAEGWDANNRIALGTAEVSPLNQAAGYATIANEGTRVPTHVIAKVTDASGKVLYTANHGGTNAIPKDITHDTTYALEHVVEEGTGRAVSDLGFEVAGKTGTSGVGDDITSAWFVAYTRQISTAVMYVAGDGGNSDLDPYRRPGDSTFFGGTYPALTWADYMRVAMEGLPRESFAEPDWVNLSGRHYGTEERQSVPQDESTGQGQGGSGSGSGSRPSSTPTPDAKPSTIEATPTPAPASTQTVTEQPGSQPTTARPRPTTTRPRPTATRTAAPRPTDGGGRDNPGDGGGNAGDGSGRGGGGGDGGGHGGGGRPAEGQ